MKFAILLLILSSVSWAQSIPAWEIVKNVQGSYQAIIVEKDETSKYRLYLLEKENQRWQSLLSIPAVIGKKGFAEIHQKKEGDQKTPTGVYALGYAFGYHAAISSLMPYIGLCCR